MEEPPVLNYRGPHRRPKQPPQKALLWFLAGLVVGVGVSMLVWMPPWVWQSSPAWVYVAWLIPLKVPVGVTMLFVPKWRWFGLGLLLSLPIGFIIFFMSCAASMRGGGGW